MWELMISHNCKTKLRWSISPWNNWSSSGVSLSSTQLLTLCVCKWSLWLNEMPQFSNNLHFKHASWYLLVRIDISRWNWRNTSLLTWLSFAAHLTEFHHNTLNAVFHVLLIWLLQMSYWHYFQADHSVTCHFTLVFNIKLLRFLQCCCSPVHKPVVLMRWTPCFICASQYIL